MDLARHSYTSIMVFRHMPMNLVIVRSVNGAHILLCTNVTWAINDLLQIEF